MNFSTEQNAAISDFVDLIAGEIGTNREIHPETAIASASVLAGSLLFRSFDIKFDKHKPGTVVLSNEANEKGPQLINLLSSFLSNSGITLDKSKLGGEVQLRGEKSKLTTLQSLELLQPKAIEIAKKHNLSLEQSSMSAAVATAFIIKECVKNIGGEVGFNVAVYGFIEGCKTVPPHLPYENKSTSTSRNRPWWKPW